MEHERHAPQAVTAANFETEVLKSPQPVLVDFSAEWCGPCRVLAPVIDKLADEYAGRLKVTTVDIDASPELAASYGIRSVPTVLLVADGEVQRALVGSRSPQEYRAALDALLH